MNKNRTRTRTIALSLVLVAAAAGAAAQDAKPAGAKPAAPTTAPAPTPAPAALPPTVFASEIDTLKITNAVQEFQLNQVALKDAQEQTETLRQKLIQAITVAAGTAKITPNYQWDFQQKAFVRQGAPEPVAPAQAAKH